MTRPSSPHPPRFARRDLLRAGGTLGLGGLLAACGSGTVTQQAPITSADSPWRRYAGTTINFISENTAPTSAIAANLKPFTELTGIKVNIVTLQLPALVQRVALDMAGGQSEYDVIYADPYQVLAPYRRGLADLRSFMADEQAPELTEPLKDFIPTQLTAAGTFGGTEEIFALPYDCPTMIWQYRTDIFEKHRDAMQQELGFDPIPNPESTWEQYVQIARWLTDNADEVPYGSGQQAKQHDSLMCDYSNVLWSYGGQYFEAGEEVGLVGTEQPGACLLGEEAAIEAAATYRSMVSVAHPGSRGWDWDGVGVALAAGQIAMCPNWHEYAASNEAALPGLIDYAPLPVGPAGTANIYGGTGIGISATSARQGAAWLFVNWATSQKTQLANLASDVGGGTPTRQSVYDLPQVAKARERPSKFPNMLTAEAVTTAWQPDYIGLRPKIPMWNECDTALFSELSAMLAGDDGPQATMRTIAGKIDSIVERGWVA